MNRQEVSPALLEYCKGVSQAIVDSVFGFRVEMSDGELTERARDLAVEFQNAHKAAGYPYGNTEEGLLRYVKDNTTYKFDT